MISNISLSRPVARKRHLCHECERSIEPGQRYETQRNTNGSDIWTYKAHIDCAALGIAYRHLHNAWRDSTDFLSMADIVDPHEYNEWRGLFPHAVTRLEFCEQMRTQREESFAQQNPEGLAA